ncbi:sensor histidine kinase [Hymenobacter sp. HSC-4F20]|nr:sensor histidine kinase [Hymenobacter sp. HSC-4F20]
MQYPFTNNRLFLAQSIWRGGYFFLLSLGYFFAVHSISTERQRRKLAEIRIEKEQLLRETETTLKELEINNLRNQINPHFLYNSLNILYSQVYPVSKKAAHGILLLSDIMRYALRDDASGKVMLEEEVQHLKNYIEMNQLRFNNSWQIKLEITGNLGFRMIIPLLLITFVENSFKHGDLLDPEHPLIIRITVENDNLTFFSRNKKRNGKKEKSTSLGLENTKKRLAIKYPNAHTLELKDELDFYTCVLHLKL